MEVLHAFIKIRPMPYKRVRGHNGRFTNPKDYRAYKKRIGNLLNREAAIQKWALAPHKGDPEYKEYLRTVRYELSLSVKRHKDIGDLSNYIKAVEDALQDFHLIGDDKLIKTLSNCTFHKIPTRDDEGIEIKLIRGYLKSGRIK